MDQVIFTLKRNTQVKLQKEVNLIKNSQTGKKGAVHAKRQHGKSCEIKGGSPEVAMVV